MFTFDFILLNHVKTSSDFFFSETQFVFSRGMQVEKQPSLSFSLQREPPSITEQLVVKCHGARRSSSIQMLMDGTSAPFHTYHPAFLLVSFQQSTRAAAVLPPCAAAGLRRHYVLFHASFCAVIAINDLELSHALNLRKLLNFLT